MASHVILFCREIPQMKTSTTAEQGHKADVGKIEGQIKILKFKPDILGWKPLIIQLLLYSSGPHVITKATTTTALDKLKMKVETNFKGLKAIIADRDGPFITTEVSGELCAVN